MERGLMEREIEAKKKKLEELKRQRAQRSQGSNVTTATNGAHAHPSVSAPPSTAEVSLLSPLSLSLFDSIRLAQFVFGNVDV